MRSTEAEAEPVYDASEGETLLVGVEMWSCTESLDATWGMTPAVMLGLDKLPSDEATDTADENEEVNGCTSEELLVPEEAMKASSVVIDAGEDDTERKPGVLVTVLPLAV